jgi:DNA gyrase subunit A
MPISTYRSQRRGGRGIQGMGTNEDDFVEHLFTTNTHHTVLFFTNKGKVYRLKGYEIPDLGRTAKGIPIINLLQIEKEEYITAVIPVEEFVEDWYLFFTTRQGISKRTSLSSFANIRKGGLFAINVREDDELMGVRLTDGERHIIIGTKDGMSIRFPETDVRLMGRTATGVKGITLGEGDRVVGMEIVEDHQDVLIVTEKGYGKRTASEEYRMQHRGGKGIRTCNITEKNGSVISLKVVSDEDDLMVITADGVIIRMHVNGISRMGRHTQGVMLIRVAEGGEVATVARVEKETDEETTEDEVESAVTDEINGRN